MTPEPGERHVRIYEVGPRDGLQNEAVAVPTDVKLRFIELLVDAGLQRDRSHLVRVAARDPPARRR